MFGYIMQFCVFKFCFRSVLQNDKKTFYSDLRTTNFIWQVLYNNFKCFFFFFSFIIIIIIILQTHNNHNKPTSHHI